MADSWEDDEFEVPVIAPVATSAPPSNWDDEDENAVSDRLVLPPPPTAAQIEAAKKKAEEEAELLARKLEFALQENETPEGMNLSCNINMIMIIFL